MAPVVLIRLCRREILRRQEVRTARAGRAESYLLVRFTMLGERRKVYQALRGQVYGGSSRQV